MLQFLFDLFFCCFYGIAVLFVMKDSSKKSEKKRRHNHTMDFEQNKKRKHSVKDIRSLNLLANETV